MPAVDTQQLAEIADLDLGPSTSAMVKALAMFDTATKNTYLRRASGEVLAAYAKRFPRTSGSSFTLAKWGDLTIGMVCSLARWMMLCDRGFDPAASADVVFKARAEESRKILDEIVDLENRTPRMDPDAVGSPDADDEGPLSHFEGGDLDQADGWTQTIRTDIGGLI